MSERPCEAEIDGLVKEAFAAGEDYRPRSHDMAEAREALEKAIEAVRAEGLAQGRRQMAEEAAALLDAKAADLRGADIEAFWPASFASMPRGRCAECDAMFEAGRQVGLDAFVARCLKGGPSWTSTLADVARFLLEHEGREPTKEAVAEKARNLGWKR